MSKSDTFFTIGKEAIVSTSKAILEEMNNLKLTPDNKIQFTIDPEEYVEIVRMATGQPPPNVIDALNEIADSFVDDN
jgi:hypothetical protein